MNQEILKNIRKNEIKGFILFLIFALFPNIFVIFSFMNEEKDWFMIILMSVISLPMD